MRRRLQQVVDGFIADATDRLMSESKIVELESKRPSSGHVRDFHEREVDDDTEVGSLPRIRMMLSVPVSSQRAGDRVSSLVPRVRAR